MCLTPTCTGCQGSRASAACAATLSNQRRRRSSYEYDVYGKFEFELENGKKSKAEWGRRWCAVMDCSQVLGWADDLATFEIELNAR